MKRVAVPALVCVLALATSACFGATITVPGDHATIGAAVPTASDGDLINVSPGTYTENVVVDKAVTIRGVQGSDVTTLTAASSTDPVVWIKSSDVTVSGFTISGSRREGDCPRDAGEWGAGVSIDGWDYADANNACISDVTVSKCVIENNEIGVLIALADDSMIVNNTIRSNEDYIGKNMCCHTSGITLCHCPYLPVPSTIGTQIVNNGLYQNDGPGIQFSLYYGPWDVTGSKISGNNFYQNGNGDARQLKQAPDIVAYSTTARMKIAGNKFVERFDLDGVPAHGFWSASAPDAQVVGNPEREDLGPNIPMPTP